MPLNVKQPFGTGPADGFLWDLEVPVTIRFARKRMLLGDVEALAGGSVVALDQSPDDPVELLVNGTVIAEGHVVNAGGNCAIRVSQLVRRKVVKEQAPDQEPRREGV